MAELTKVRGSTGILKQDVMYFKDLTFGGGGTITDRRQIVKYTSNGLWYQLNEGVQLGHPVPSAPDSNFTLLGNLQGYAMNDIRNYGAVADLVRLGAAATDCSAAWELCYSYCKSTGEPMVLPDAPIYVGSTVSAGDVFITSKSGEAGFADVYYGRDRYGNNFIDGSNSANWEYFYNTGSGASKTWFDMTKIAYGCLVCSDVASPILKKKPDEKFNIKGIGVLGNHRLIGQVGIDSGTPVMYVGERHNINYVTVIGCGSHGIHMKCGWEISTSAGLNLYANNGAGMLIDKATGITSPVEYLTIKDAKVWHNRISGIQLTHVRTNVTFDNIIGNNTGQYDCPLITDPLLNYWRGINASVFNRTAALINIKSGALDTDTTYGGMYYITFNNIVGEQIVDMIMVSSRVGEGSANGLVFTNIKGTELSKITGTSTKGCGVLVQAKYTADVTIQRNYFTDNITYMDFSNTDLAEVGTGITDNYSKVLSIREKSLFRKDGMIVVELSESQTGSSNQYDVRHLINNSSRKLVNNRFRIIATKGSDIQTAYLEYVGALPKASIMTTTGSLLSGIYGDQGYITFTAAAGSKAYLVCG